jgi:hypothetical protein
MRQKDDSCSRCEKNTNTPSKRNYTFFAGILLAILPKCPFCMMAYSSTVMLCGNNSVSSYQQGHQSLTTICITSFFCLLVVAGLLLNYQGRRTKIALAISTFGIFLIMRTIFYGGGQELYYLGVSVVFMGVWLNGSLIRLFGKLRNPTGMKRVNVTTGASLS